MTPTTQDIRATDVVVIGGGLAGMTAALDLADAGRSVTLLESRPRLGGATASFRRGALQVDTGQHVFLRCCTAYRALLDRLGVTDQTTLQSRLNIPVVATRPDGRVRRTSLRRSDRRPPAHLAAGLLRYRALPLADRLRSVPATVALGRLDPADPAVDAQSFGDWLAAHGQRPAAIEAIWGLLTVATLNLQPAEASLALAATVVRLGLLDTAGGADIGVATVPLGQLHGDAFARAFGQRGVLVRTSARAVQVGAGDRGYEVRSNGEVLAAAGVVLAVPPPAAAALAPAAAGVDGERLHRLGSEPIVNVHVLFDRPVLDVPFLAAVGSPAQWIFDRGAASGIGQGRYVALSLSAASGWLPMRTTELREIFVPELRRLLPAARAARVVDVFVTREPHATFRQAPGQAALRPPQRTALAGLALAGAWTDTGWPATMEGAVRSGHAAATAVLAGADWTLPRAVVSSSPHPTGRRQPARGAA